MSKVKKNVIHFGWREYALLCSFQFFFIAVASDPRISRGGPLPNKFRIKWSSFLNGWMPDLTFHAWVTSHHADARRSSRCHRTLHCQKKSCNFFYLCNVVLDSPNSKNNYENS